MRKGHQNKECKIYEIKQRASEVEGNQKNKGTSHQVTPILQRNQRDGDEEVNGEKVIERHEGGSSIPVEIANEVLRRHEVRDGKNVIEKCMPYLNIRIESEERNFAVGSSNMKWSQMIEV